MASALYDKGRERFLGPSSGQINWANDDIKVVLVKDTYSFNAAHEFRSSLNTHENGTSANLSGKSVTSGVADANDTSITATDGDACDALVIYKDTGNAATDPLIAYIDDPVAGLPMTPEASQVLPIAWDNGSNKIFKL